MKYHILTFPLVESPEGVNKVVLDYFEENGPFSFDPHRLKTLFASLPDTSPCGWLLELFKIFADRAAHDEQVRPEQRMQARQIVVDARTPGGPVQPLRGAHPRRRSQFSVLAVKLHVAEFGIGHQFAVEK